MYCLCTKGSTHSQRLDLGSTGSTQEPLKRLCDDASFSTEILSLSSKEVTADLTARAEQGNLLFENKARPACISHGCHDPNDPKCYSINV